MKRSFNVKFFAILVGAAACLAVGVHFLHAYQVRRSAGSLLEQARQAEAGGDLYNATELLNNYLGYVPGDIETLANYGLLLDKMSAPSVGHSMDPRVRFRALLVLEKVLRIEADRPDLRRRLAKISVDLGRFTDAQDHVDKLLTSSGPDGELQRLKGQYFEGLNYPGAADCYRSAIQLSPQDLQSYDLLADLWHRQNDSRENDDEFMKSLSKLFEKEQPYQAYLGRARLWKELKASKNGKKAVFEKAEKDDIEKAQQLAPQEVEVILSVSEMARGKGNLNKARELLTDGLKYHSNNTAIYMALAQVELDDHNPEKAQEWLAEGLSKLPNEHALLWGLANLKVDKCQKPDGEIACLRKLGVSIAELDFLRGRLALRQENWLEAAQVMESVRLQLTKSPEVSKQIEFSLGEAYRQLGELDQSYAAYRRASDIDPQWPPAARAMGSLLLSMGKIDEAIGVYQRVIPQAPAAQVEVARLRILKNIRLPKAQRNWDQVAEDLTGAEKAVPESTDIPLLRADMFLIQGKLDQAISLLTGARDKHPKEVTFWLVLAELTDRKGNSGAALGLLDEVQKQVGDSAELRVARARYWSGRDGVSAKKALAELEENVSGFSKAQQHFLWRGLAAAYVRLGDLKKAEELWRRIADQQPQDLASKVVLFDLALEMGNPEAMDHCIQEIKNIEGSDGILWRYGQASELIWQAKKTKNPELLKDARAQLIRVAAHRPAWSRVALCEARIDDLSETLQENPNPNFSAAIKNYLLAIDQGERNPDVVRRVLQLLYVGKRFDEALKVFQKLPAQSPLSSDMQRLEADLTFQTHDLERALSLAEKVAKDSTDYRDHLWLGQMFWANRKPKEAVAAFARAVKLKDTAPEVWVAWINALVATEQLSQAETALKEAQAKLPRDNSAAVLALAQCYEVLKHDQEALDRYEIARRSNPNDVPTLRSLATSHLTRNQTKEAEPHLRKIIQLRQGQPEDEDADWARIMLAILLTGSGSHEKIVEAETLLGIPEPNQPVQSTAKPKLEKLRAQALVLAMQSRKSKHRQAIEIFEKQVAPLGPLSIDDQFLLAKLYDSVGNWTKARSLIEAVATASPNQASFAVAFARGLVLHQELDSAKVWVAKLEKMPDVVNTFDFVDIQARLLVAQNKTDQAVELIKAFSDRKDAKPPDRLDRVRLAAGLLDALSQTYPKEKGLGAAAERLYREYVDAKPDQMLALIGFLGRQGRVEDALNWCDRAWQACPAETVANGCMALLHEPKVAKEQYERVDGWLESARMKHPEVATALTVCLADLRDLQGRPEEAVKLYRQVLEKNPREFVALNNLAWLLALHPGPEQHAEALNLINQAIQILGPVSAVLDTRAVVYMSLDQPDKAIKDLEKAIEESSQPVFHFHLAEARLMQYARSKMMEDQAKAAEALRQAKALGIQPERLHSLDRVGYQSLTEKLKN
jgi:tetratricopeptide (TPR) repeat protein